jgi:hypothetical protein
MIDNEHTDLLNVAGVAAAIVSASPISREEGELDMSTLGLGRVYTAWVKSAQSQARLWLSDVRCRTKSRHSTIIEMHALARVRHADFRLPAPSLRNLPPTSFENRT